MRHATTHAGRGSATRCSTLVALLLASLGGPEPRASAAPSSRAAWEPATTWALMVGVLEWKDPSLHPFPKKDRADRAFERTLVARGVPASHVTFLEDSEATLAACRAALSRTAEAAGPGSTILVYFAGHGVQSGGATWFANTDLDVKRLGDTGWAVTEIGDVLASTWKGSRAILIADCCHSGALEQVVHRFDRSKTVRAACLPSALACNESTGAWTFTQSVDAAFRGDPLADTDGDGVVTFAETDSFVRTEMRFREAQLTEGARTPAFERDFALATVDTGAARRPMGTWRGGRYAEAEVDGAWRRVEIVAVDGEHAQVRDVARVPGKPFSIALASLRPPQPIAAAAGDEVDVRWGGKWWSGVVREVRDDFALVHYEGWGDEWDEWVGRPRLRPRSKGAR
jgi:hypothetical protein